MTVGIPPGGVGGLGQGTRVTKRLGEGSELWLYVKQGLVGAVALNVALSVAIVSVLIVGWYAVPLLVMLMGVGVFLSAASFARMLGWRVSDDWWLEIAKWTVFACLAIGALCAWYWHDRVMPALRLAVEQAAPLVTLPWWVYAIVGAIILVLAWLKRWGLALLLVVGAALVYVVSRSPAGTGARIWGPVRWLLLPYLWPFGGFALLIAAKMVQEIRFPNLEWTAAPVKRQELAGHGGLFVPRLVAPEPAAPPTEMITVQVVDEGGRTIERADVLKSRKAYEFYKAVAAGASFSEATARKAHISPAKFAECIREPMRSRGWVKWVDENDHTAGIEILNKGRVNIQALAERANGNGAFHSPTPLPATQDAQMQG